MSNHSNNIPTSDSLLTDDSLTENNQRVSSNIYLDTIISSWNKLSLNIRFLSNLEKQRTLYEIANNLNLDIVFLQETNIRTSQLFSQFSHTHSSSKPTKYYINNPSTYQVWINDDNGKRTGNGTAILIKKNLAKHVYKVDYPPGYGIAFTFTFKGKYKLTFLNFYYPSITKHNTIT